MTSNAEFRPLTRITGHLCRGLLVTATLFYTADAILPSDLSRITGWLGILILITGIPLIKASYRRPAIVFLAVSFILILTEDIPLTIIIEGVNSMLSITAIMTALQIFLLPIRAGGYDKTLERYLKGRFSSESALYLFVSFIAHIVGSFMLFGTVPMLYTFFGSPVKEMVKDPARFTVTAIGRSFTLVTLWAPGAVSVVLVMESTGADWLTVLPAALILTVIGFATSIMLESFTVLRGKKISVTGNIPGDSYTDDNRKIAVLVIIAAVLLAGIMLLDILNLLSGSARVIVVGLVTAAVWLLFHRKGRGIMAPLAEYWNNSLGVVPDLAILFMSMGIFTRVVQASPFIESIRGWIISASEIMGPFSFLIVTPVIVILSLTGIHPFMGVALLGSLLSSVLPEQANMIALGLLLGSAISYSVSPFAGTLITLSRFAGCSPAKAAFSWNGIFSLLFLIEGITVLSLTALFIN